MLNVIVCMVCLALVFAVCLAGLLAEGFRESWGQFFGLAGVAYWCFGKLFLIWERGYVLPENMLLHVSLAVFACSAAVKVAHQIKLANLRWPELPTMHSLEPRQMSRVRGEGWTR